MSRHKLSARDKITRKMSRDGVIERNETKGEDIRISKREEEMDLRGDAPKRHTLSQGGTRSAEHVGGRSKKKQRQIGAFHDREVARQEAIINNGESPAQSVQPLADVAHLSFDVTHNIPVQQSDVENAQEAHVEYIAHVNMTTEPPRSALKHNLQSVNAVFNHESVAPIFNTAVESQAFQDEIPNTEVTASPVNPRDPPPKRSIVPPRMETLFQHDTRSAKMLATEIQPTSKKPLVKVNVENDFSSANGGADDNIDDNADGGVVDSSDAPILANANNNQADEQLPPNKPGKLQFSPDEPTPDHPQAKPDRKLRKAERQAERANAKLEQARNNLPGKKKLRAERVFDEQTGKGTQKLRFEKEVIPQGEHIKGTLPMRPVKMAANAGIAKFHSKMFQVEHENVEIKAAHRTEMAAEGGIRSALRHRKTAKYRKVAKLERQAAKKATNLAYRKTLADNPKLRSNPFSRMWQKRKMRKEYAKKARNAKRAAGMVKKTSALTVKATRLVTKLLAKNPKVWVLAGIVGFIMLIIMSMFSLATSIGSGGMGAVLASSYLTEAEDIETAAIVYSEWETDLRLEILNVQMNHPGFNEYRFDIGTIRHCPVMLMAFLTAVHHDFVFADIEEAMRELFYAQYTLTFTPSIEIRYAPPTEPEGEPIPFEWHVMTVTLVSRPFAEVIQSLMTPDQQLHHEVLMQTKGNRQVVGSPFDFYWFPFVTSHYGYRVHPITGVRSFHRGIDVGLPTGTPILAAHDGVVTVSQYMGSFGNVVFIVGENGIETRYAHADTLLVSVGDVVTMGDVIATVGSTGESTGPHLHFEILYNGSHKNPAFFSFMGG